MNNLRLTQITASLDMKLGGPAAVVLNSHKFFAQKYSNYSLLVFGESVLNNSQIIKAATLFGNRFALLINLLNVAFIRRLRQSEVILIHGYYLFSTIYSILFYQGDKIFLMPHGTFEFYQQKRHKLRKMVFTFLLNMVLKTRKIHFLVASESEISSLETKFPKNPITVVGLGINLPKLIVGDQKIDNGTKLIFLGRIAEKKRIDLCLHAIQKLKLKGHQIYFDIVGTGNNSLIETLTNLVRELNIEENVNFLGHLENEELSIALARSHIFVLPSENENFAIAVAESIGASVPVIVSKNVAMHHFVDQYQVGITIEDLNSDLLSQAILKLIDNHSHFKENCIKHRALLDWSLVFTEWEKIITKGVRI